MSDLIDADRFCRR